MSFTQLFGQICLNWDPASVAIIRGPVCNSYISSGTTGKRWLERKAEDPVSHRSRWIQNQAKRHRAGEEAIGRTKKGAQQKERAWKAVDRQDPLRWHRRRNIRLSFHCLKSVNPSRLVNYTAACSLDGCSSSSMPRPLPSLPIPDMTVVKPEHAVADEAA